MALASLTYKGKTLQLRTNPNLIRWTYTLNTKVDETYGGRVVQILSASMDDLTVTAEAGRGGWAYLYQVAVFMRDMMFEQRQGGEPGTFTYPTRNWVFKVYAVNFPFKDSWNEVAREFTLTFKIQEDVNGVVTSDTIAGEIERLKKGIEYEHNDFNTNSDDPGSAAWPTWGSGAKTADGSKKPDGTPADQDSKKAPSNTPQPGRSTTPNPGGQTPRIGTGGSF